MDDSDGSDSDPGGRLNSVNPFDNAVSCSGASSASDSGSDDGGTDKPFDYDDPDLKGLDSMSEGEIARLRIKKWTELNYYLTNTSIDTSEYDEEFKPSMDIRRMVYYIQLFDATLGRDKSMERIAMVWYALAWIIGMTISGGAKLGQKYIKSEMVKRYIASGQKMDSFVGTLRREVQETETGRRILFRLSQRYGKYVNPDHPFVEAIVLTVTAGFTHMLLSDLNASIGGIMENIAPDFGDLVNEPPGTTPSAPGGGGMMGGGLGGIMNALGGGGAGGFEGIMNNVMGMFGGANGPAAAAFNGPTAAAPSTDPGPMPEPREEGVVPPASAGDMTQGRITELSDLPLSQPISHQRAVPAREQFAIPHERIRELEARHVRRPPSPPGSPPRTTRPRRTRWGPPNRRTIADGRVGKSTPPSSPPRSPAPAGGNDLVALLRAAEADVRS